MKASKILMLGIFCYVFSTPGIASEIVHEFSNPSFSGQGYSTHVLSLGQVPSHSVPNILSTNCLDKLA